MRNRAKCKLCEGIIESYHSEDYVTCKCDEISVYGGNAMKCAAKDFKNFVRVDDDGNEIIPTILETDDSASHTQEHHEKSISKKQKLDMLQALIESIEKLPSHALYAPVTHHDLLTSLTLVSSILRDS